MASAPLNQILAAEAATAVVAGGALLVWTGAAASYLTLPPTPPSWAVVRLAAVLLIGFGSLLWAVRHYAATQRSAIQTLAIGHALGATVLALQHVAVWNTRTGLLLAAVPFGLAVRYAQYGFRRRQLALSASTAPSA